MDRRAFIKLTAVTGTSAVLASCGNPEHELIRFVPDEDLVPGIAEWKPSMCPVCRAGCGVMVRVIEGDAEVVRNSQRGVMKMALARKLEGNQAHPVSQGALCPRGQAAIQLTYHPDRIAHPLKRSGSREAGKFEAITWEAAIAELVSRLDGLADPHALAVVTRAGTSVRHELVAAFLDRFGAPPSVPFEVFSDDVLRRANAMSFAREQVPTFDLSHSRYVIAFGADFLGTWNSPVAQGVAYGQMRQGRPGVRGKFVQVEPRMSQTGANADEWIAARLGTEGVLALGLAHVILAGKLRPRDAAGRAGALIDGWSDGLTAHTPEAVAQRTGVAAPRIVRLAHELAADRPAVAIIGGAPLAHTNGLFQALAVNALNALLGSVGEPGGLQFQPQLARAIKTSRGASARTLSKLATDMLSAERSPVQLLLLDGANPVFGAPSAWRVRDALLKVPFIVSFGSFLDDTSVLADLILPDHSFLESWVDARPESGASVAVATIAPPAMRPIHETRATPDVLLEVAGRLKRPLNLPWKTYEELLHAATVAGVSAADADDAWAEACRQGGVWSGTGSPSAAAMPAAPVMPHSSPVRDRESRFDGDASEFPFHLLPFASTGGLDGSTAHLPWLQELPDPLTSAMWSTWVEINPQTAARLQIADGDVVELTSSQGALRAPAIVSPGIAPDVIAMPVGQGHRAFTRYASGRGENPLRLVAPIVEDETGSLAWAATRVRVSRVGGRDGSLILFAGSKTEHPDRSR
jgi:anaerobic selenocysteine-containing dehydrogenase